MNAHELTPSSTIATDSEVLWLTRSRARWVVFAVTVLAFLPALRAGWLWDDHFFFNPIAPLLQSPSHGADIFTRDLFGASSLGHKQDTYRPLTVWAWSFLVPLTGGAAWALHAWSVLLHGVAAVLVLELAVALGASRLASMVAALAFAVSAAQVEAVVWIAGVHGVAETALTLGAALAVVRLQGWRQVLAVSVCAASALLCKESGLLAVPVALGLSMARRPRAWRQHAALGGALLLVVVAYLLWRRHLALPVGRPAPSLLGLVTLVDALGIALVWPPIPDITRPLLPSLIDGLRGVLVLTLIGGVVLWRTRDRLLAGVLLGLGLLALMLYGPIAAQTTIASDRYLYLPLALWWTAMAHVIPADVPALARRRWLVATATLLTLRAAFAVACMGDLTNDIVAFSSSIAQQPHSPDNHYHLGVALARAGQPDAAIAALQTGLQLRPGDPRMWSNLTGLLVNLKRDGDAAALIARFDTVQPPSAKAAYNLGLAAARTGDPATAKRLAQRALQLDPRYAKAKALLQP